MLENLFMPRLQPHLISSPINFNQLQACSQ